MVGPPNENFDSLQMNNLDLFNEVVEECLDEVPTSLLQIDRLQPIMILKPIEMKLLTQPMRNKLVKNRRVTV